MACAAVVAPPSRQQFPAGLDEHLGAGDDIRIVGIFTPVMGLIPAIDGT